MLTIAEKDYPTIFKVLDLVWEDNIPEFSEGAGKGTFASDRDDEYTFAADGQHWASKKNWDLKTIEEVLKTLSEEELEVLAFGEYDDRQALLKAKPQLKETDDLVETFFEALMGGTADRR